MSVDFDAIVVLRSDSFAARPDTGHYGLDPVAVNGFDALGRHGEGDPAVLTGQVVGLALDIRVPAPVGPLVGMRDGFAETGFTAGDLAVRRHAGSLRRFWKMTIVFDNSIRALYRGACRIENHYRKG